MVWLVEVRLLDTTLDPWVLLKDLEVEREAQALRIFEMYRQRWSVEDSFKFSKECLGWEEVQVLDLEGIRTLVALAWVAAGFLYQLGVTLEWEAVQLLAKLGGWELRADVAFGDEAGNRWVEVAPPGSATRLALNPPMGDWQPGGSSIGVETPDVEAEYARVRQIGGVTTGEMMGGEGPVPRMFSIVDPDGNHIWVVQAA